MEKPLPSDYLNFREYLRDAFSAEKKAKRYFSHAYLAKVCGFGSTGYIKMVIDGQRNLSAKSIHKVAQAFGLAKKQSAYFETLVFLNQAKTESERETFRERLLALMPKRPKLAGLAKDKYDYFTKSYYAIIREMVALPNFNEDPQWIAKQISPIISPLQAQRSLKTLLDLGLIERTKTGKLVQTDKVISTPEEIQSREVFQYHSQMLDRAKEALTTIHEDLRHVTALTLPITFETLPLLKEKIQELREAVLHAVNTGDANFDEVYQLNIQCFPVTKISDRMRLKP